jgi:hypothetical protein
MKVQPPRQAAHERWVHGGPRPACRQRQAQLAVPARHLCECAQIRPETPRRRAFACFALPVPASRCLVRIATGLPCPGCGLTRAVKAATRGHFIKAFRAHPLWLVVLLHALACTAAAGQEMTGREGRWPTRGTTQTFLAAAVIIWLPRLHDASDRPPA